MNMKLILTLTFSFISILSFSQVNGEVYYDTLYYKEDVIKPCTITKKDDKKVFFRATTKKGIVYTSSISYNSLKYYVDYDSTGTVLLSDEKSLQFEKDPSKVEYKMVTDTLEVSQHHISANPIALGVLGLDIDYMVRFTNKPRLAFNVPFRIHTLFGNTFFLNAGLGFNFIPYNTPKTHIYVGLGAHYYNAEGESAVGFPVKLGLTTSISKNLTFHGSLGGGPYLGNYSAFGNVVGDLHLGIGYRFGNKLTVTNTNKEKVWKEN